jgi:hypothetical protein
VGLIDIEKERDRWDYVVEKGVGSASTTNTSITHDDVKKNPIGFIWERDDTPEL